MTEQTKGILVVQARNGSTRFPYKSVTMLDGYPVLEHVIRRLRQSHYLGDSIIVATSDSPEDNSIAHITELLSTPVFRGSQENVLSRFTKISELVSPSYIVRVTGDCPFINPQVVDRIVETYLKADYDYVSNTLKRTFPKGFDVECFSSSLLLEAIDDHRSQEHVTPFIYNSARYLTHSYLSEIDYSTLRCTLDFPEDLELLQSILEMHRICDPSSPDFLSLSAGDISSIIDQYPDIQRLHALAVDKALCYGEHPNLR